MLVLLGVSIHQKENKFKNSIGFQEQRKINIDQGKDEYYFWEVIIDRKSVVLLKLNRDRFKVCHQHILT